MNIIQLLILFNQMINKYKQLIFLIMVILNGEIFQVKIKIEFQVKIKIESQVKIKIESQVKIKIEFQV